MSKILKHAISLWLELTSGQKKTLWVAAFLSPVLPLTVELMRVSIDPEIPQMFSTIELFIYGWTAAFLPLVLIAFLANLSSSKP